MEFSAPDVSLAGSRGTVVSGLLIAFLSYVVYAMGDASVKLLHAGIPPFELVFFGALLGLPVIPFACKPGERLGDMFRCNNRMMWTLRAAAALAGSVTSVIAFTMLPMAVAFALVFTLPAFVTVLSVIFLKEQVGWRRWTAVVMGFVGVLIVLRPGVQAIGLGHVAGILAGLTGAITIVIMRALGPTEKRVSLYGAGLVGPIVGSFVLMLPGFVLPTAHQWVFVLSYGLLSSLGNYLMMLAASKAPASLVAPPQYSQMLWGIAFGYFLFGEAVDLLMIVGSGVIIASGLFTFARERARRPRFWNRNPLIHPQ